MFTEGFQKIAAKEECDNKMMALSDLENISRKAAYLHKLMSEVKEVPPWVIEKLGITRETLGSLMDFVAPQTSEGNPLKKGKMK